MSDSDNRLQELLDGKLSIEEIAADPILSSLAERIYGSEFLETAGITRGDTKRALAEQFSEIEGDDLLIEALPDMELPLPMPGDMPPNPANESESTTDSENRSKMPIVLPGMGLLIGVANLFGALSILGGNCTGGGCPSDGHTRLNWASIGNMDSGWGWSPSILDGSFGTPDIILVGICGLLIIKGLLRK